MPSFSAESMQLGLEVMPPNVELHAIVRSIPLLTIAGHQPVPHATMTLPLLVLLNSNSARPLAPQKKCVCTCEGTVRVCPCVCVRVCVCVVRVGCFPEVARALSGF